MNPQHFVAKWRHVEGTERSLVQSHFNDLCALIGHPTPTDVPSLTFTFEAGVSKTSGGQGFADVWKRGFFAWEYKGKDANLDKAYQQLLQYRESLENPPLLVVSDINRIVVHTNFTNTVKRVVTLTLDDLLTVKGREALWAVFHEPAQFRSEQTPQQVTEEAARRSAARADHLRGHGHAPERIAHFLIRLLFCLFAEDIDLLPRGLFTRLLASRLHEPERFAAALRQLFAAMATGGDFGVEAIRHFNGGLFDDDAVLPLDAAGLAILQGIAGLDWGSIEPSILGTLFERGLDPDKRSQLGAHYTSREDILLIVEPVLMAPWRREWAQVQARALALAEQRGQTADLGTRTRRQNELRRELEGFAQRLTTVRVLDPACGSGNFLYIALRQLLDLEKEVSRFAGEVGLPGLLPQVGPTQLYGIEVNEYAHELAQATVWIGYIQWLHENGFGVPSAPILKRMDNIRQMDAILAYDAAGKPVEPAWPEADVIIGNPPFLGDRRMREELGENYVEAIRFLYFDRIPGVVDLVCYWFAKATDAVRDGMGSRVGLLATNSIRHGDSRRVLDRILQQGGIFMAWSDRPWVLDGAAVRVAMVGFDNGNEQDKCLDGQIVTRINADLTANLDLTTAIVLSENANLAFSGTKKYGPFEIPENVAAEMLDCPTNPNGRPNSDVLVPWINGQDITRRPRGYWIIDFGDMDLGAASLYEQPFAYVEKHVKPARSDVRNERLRREWWLYEARRPNLYKAIDGLTRFIVTPAVSRHRVFVWVKPPTQPDQQLIVFARSDDYFFGLLHSRPHELWVVSKGNRLGIGNDPRYNATETFATFPFPWPPGQEPADDPRVAAIAVAAQELHEKRSVWLNPPGASEAELKTRTLTKLYNQRPMWLDLLHQRLDAAVAAAYGWPADLDDDAVLGRLLALNLARAGNQ